MQATDQQINSINFGREAEQQRQQSFMDLKTQYLNVMRDFTVL